MKPSQYVFYRSCFSPSSYLVACSRRACSYVGWVQYFGTHYRIQANMGGLLHVDSFLNENYFASAKIDWTTFQINLSFYSSLFDLFGKAGGFTNRSSIDVSEEFLENSSNYIFYYGGRPASLPIPMPSTPRSQTSRPRCRPP